MMPHSATEPETVDLDAAGSHGSEQVGAPLCGSFP
jgi:hypothetical protein